MVEVFEGFVYLWYNSIKKMFYLGVHKGTPDDGYTHSSSIWESFTMDTIPKGVRRRILAYGTYEEMCILENKLLVNRKNRRWDRYYNRSLGSPRYIDQSGENHPFWKKNLPPEHRAKISKAMTGKKHTPEALAKMTGRKFTSEHRAKLSKAKTGRILPPEVRANISKTQTGQNNSYSKTNILKRQTK